MQIPSRSFSESFLKYRFGFNGKENDGEVKGDGNQQDYGMRIYDPRLGKFLSVDPFTKDYPMLSPYQFAGNSPVGGIDLEGGELLPTSSSIFRQKYFGTNSIEKSSAGSVVREIYENIPKVLNNQIPGPPLHPSGRDWDVSKDGYHPAFGTSVKAEGTPSASYFFNGPSFHRDDITPEQEELELKSISVRNGHNKISDRIEYSRKWVYEPIKDFKKDVGGAPTAAQELVWYKDLYSKKVPVWKAMTYVDQQRQAFYRATKMVDYIIANTPQLRSSFPFSMKMPDMPGFARADLINYVLDGSLPAAAPAGMNSQNFSNYLKNIASWGNSIMEANGISLDPRTQMQTNSKINKIKPHEGRGASTMSKLVKSTNE
jgi:RHS repeat-associated protein